MKYKKMWYQLMKEIQTNSKYGDESDRAGMRKALDAMIELEWKNIPDSRENGGEDID